MRSILSKQNDDTVLFEEVRIFAIMISAFPMAVLGRKHRHHICLEATMKPISGDIQNYHFEIAAFYSNFEPKADKKSLKLFSLKLTRARIYARGNK